MVQVTGGFFRRRRFSWSRQESQQSMKPINGLQPHGQAADCAPTLIAVGRRFLIVINWEENNNEW